MRLAALLLGVFIALGCSSVSAHDFDYALAKTKYRIWLDVCLDYRSEVTCGDIEAPKVERVPLREGLNGYYDGGDTVYINRNLRGWERDATIAHEMSHYLDTQLGMNPEMPVKRSDLEGVFGLCMSEKRAWAVTDKYWKRYGAWKKQEIGARWVRWYSHCRQFADRLYPDIYAEPLPELRWVVVRKRGLFSH